MFFYSLALSLTFLVAGQQSVHPILDQHLRGMESAFREGRQLDIAQFYADDGYLIGPKGIISQGREAIDEYWTSDSEPVDWQLESFVVSDNLDELKNDSIYLSWKNPPPFWDEFDIELPEDKTYLYQLGRSTLQSKWEGKASTSIVNFLLAWEKITDDTYKIVVDSYAGIH